MRFSGHCWQSKEELAHQLLLWEPTHDKRACGRPRQTFIDQLADDTELKKISQMRWMTESIGKAKLWMSDCSRPSKVNNLAIKFFLLLGSFRSLTKLKVLSLLLLNHSFFLTQHNPFIYVLVHSCFSLYKLHILNVNHQLWCYGLDQHKKEEKKKNLNVMNKNFFMRKKIFRPNNW